MPERPDFMCNYIVSVVRARRTPLGIRFHGLAGTAFLLSRTTGIAMTAWHVAENLVIGEAAVLFLTGDGSWEMAAVEETRLHPTQDVALLRLEPGDYPSPFALSRVEMSGAQPYSLSYSA